MTHTWKVGGSRGLWVHHSSGGSGTDSIGVGLAEDTLGPFSSRKLAAKVADALNSAYTAGVRDTEESYAEPYDPYADERAHFSRGPEPPAATDR